MTWHIVLFTMGLIVAGVAALLWVFSAGDKARARGKTVTIGALAAAVLFFLLGSFTIVGTRQIAIVTAFGRPNGVSLNNGFHGKWPWQMTHQMDGAVQIDKYVKEGNNDQRIMVRLGNQSTALADVSIRWQLKQPSTLTRIDRSKSSQQWLLVLPSRSPHCCSPLLERFRVCLQYHLHSICCTA